MSEPSPAGARRPIVLEICVDDLNGLHAAISGGADRIELCSALALGGLTPSTAFARDAVKTGVPVHTLIRPRSGVFEYDGREIALIVEDIRRLADVGVAGVVVGATDSAGRLNPIALEQFRSAAKDIAVVLHRAIDLSPDPVEEAGIAADLGYDFILTSGGATQAFDGRQTIAKMVAKAAGRLEIIAGSGVTPDNAAALVRETGVTQIHASARRACEWADPRIEEFGFAAGPQRVTDAQNVAALKQAIASLN